MFHGQPNFAASVKFPAIIKMLKTLLLLALLVLIAIVVINWLVYRRGRALIRPSEELAPAPVALVFGAYVAPDGTPSSAVEDRLVTAWKLFESGKVAKLILSGDHGQSDYDEVNGMKEYLERRGVPKDVLFLDHAGFDTYDSLLRAREVFGVEEVILVTQEFHLPRALYIADKLGLKAQGAVADRRSLADLGKLQMREVAARIKAFLEVAWGRNPKYLGDPISLDGKASATHDKD